MVPNQSIRVAASTTARERAFAIARSAGWFALALIGQAVALRMIDAGNLIHYQHFKSLTRLASETPLLLLFFIAQTVIVAIGLSNRTRRIYAWGRNHFEWWQIALIAFVFIVSSAALSAQISSYIAELILAAFIQAVNLGNVVLLAWSIPENMLIAFKQRVDEFLGGAVHTGRLDRVVFVGAAWITIVTMLLAFFVYQAHPHVPDEVIYVYQARYFAAGELTVPAAPVAEAFSIYMIPFKSNEWYSPFSPGWSMVLALGVRLGAPWLVNPLLAGLCVLIAYLLIQELYNRRVARMMLVLLCASPWFIFMGMNLMSHTFTLLCFLVAALGIVWARRTGHARWGWLAGGAVGTISLIRPLDGAIVAVLFGLWSIGARLKFSAIAGFVAGAILIGAAVLPYNWLVIGSPTAIPLDAYYEQYFGHNVNALGFGPERGMGWSIDAFPGHSSLEAMINNLLNLFSLNIELLGWSIGSLIFATIFVVAGKKEKRDWLLFAVIAAFVGVYSLYWYSGGPDFGARYWYLILIPVLMLTVRGIQFVNTILPDARVMFAVFVLSALALVNYVPWRATDKYYHFLQMSPDILALAADNNFGKSVVLIRGDSHPDYASAWIYNSLDWNADVPVYAWDQNAAMCRQVVAAYADRPVWVVDGPSLTHSSYQVASSPTLRTDFECK